MTTRIFRPAEWTIGADREEGASPPIRVTECTTCDARSDAVAASAQPATDRWAISHAAETGHRGFREVVTAFIRVRPAPSSPLFEEKR